MGGSELSARHIDSSREKQSSSHRRGAIAVGRLRASRATQGSGDGELNGVGRGNVQSIIHRGKATNALHHVARDK